MNLDMREKAEQIDACVLKIRRQTFRTHHLLEALRSTMGEIHVLGAGKQQSLLYERLEDLVQMAQQENTKSLGPTEQIEALGGAANAT